MILANGTAITAAHGFPGMNLKGLIMIVLIGKDERIHNMTFEEWDEVNPPMVKFNLIVTLTMHGDCHVKADRELHEALNEVITDVRRDVFDKLSRAE